MRKPMTILCVETYNRIYELIKWSTLESELIFLDQSIKEKKLMNNDFDLNCGFQYIHEKSSAVVNV